MYSLQAKTVKAALCYLLCMSVLIRSEGVRTYGPYKVKISELASCEDGGTNQIRFPTKMYSLGRDRTPYANGTVVFGVPMNDKYWVYVELAVHGSQGYRRRFMHQTAKGCEEVMRAASKFFKRLYAAGGMTVDKCPLPAAELHINGTEVHFDIDIIKELPYNKYKLIAIFKYDKVKTGCMIVYGDVVPEN